MSKEDDYCNCNAGIYYSYFMKDGNERKGMYCNKCRKLLDDIPQY